ncbi:MAG: hypothetical protein KA384_09310 [Leptotrichiaceae bacterium]|nr:hypothetical protein [Leptotrichiaceae bacterium]
MENLNVFVDKKEINELYNKEKYKNCMDKKYFEYIVSNGKIDYIDKYLGNSKNKNIVESLLLKNNTAMVIDKLSVTVEGKRYIGELENLEIDDIEVSEKIVEVYHDQILTKGIFALIKLEENIDNKYPYYIEEIEILEDTDIKLEDYKEYFLEKVKNNKDKFSPERILQLLMVTDKEEEISGIDLVLNTIGISTKELTFWEKILFLVRLIPLCESNYNLMELGGNGIGKTKTYTMFSPECEIVQEMLTTEIIYNRQSKTPGLLKTKDVIVFDEINKLKFDGDKEKIIPALLNFMADGQTTSPRKVISKTSFVFSGNTMGIQERIEKNERNVFDKQHKLEDDAFLDRIYFFLPAWGLRRFSKNIHGLGSSKKVFRFDYFSKVLSLLRDEDYSDILDERGYIIRGNSQSEREVTAVRKTVSGLIKLTHPNREIDDITLEAYIAIAIKGRGLINKFLNNKNKNNVNKIDTEVKKRKGMFTKVEEEVQVNESLKELITTYEFENLNKYFEAYKNHMYDKETPKIEKIKHRMERYFEEKEKAENRAFYNERFYPNRKIAVFDYKDNKGEILIIKFALDKIGVTKNNREKRIIEKIYNYKGTVDLLNNGEILIFISNKSFVGVELDCNLEKKYGEYLYSKEDLNYDVLFGEQSLDENDFTGKSMDEGTRMFEADLSNLYFIDKGKKLKHENGEYIIPEFKYNSKVDKYYYEYELEKEPEVKKTSEMMTYVEFKYFLANNGFIELN